MADQYPTKEELNEFWKWCGFNYRQLTWLDTLHTRFEQEGWIYPDGTMGSTPEKLFNLPTLDLNSLFKWAVPKLEHWHIQKTYKEFRREQVYVAVQGQLGDRFSNYWGDNPALALFWAIWGAAGLE